MQVSYVDFGGREWVEPSSLLQLPDGVVELPPFALCCRLANIEPVSAGFSDAADWTQQAADFLRAETDKKLIETGPDDDDVTDRKLFMAWLDESLPVGAIVRYRQLLTHGHSLRCFSSVFYDLCCSDTVANS